MPAPDTPDVLDYLGAGYDEDVVERTLAVEKAAQAKRCVVPGDDEDWPADLVEALKRRVLRNLAMKNLPLGVQSDELGSTFIGATDPEVRRLEGPYRRLFVG